MKEAGGHGGSTPTQIIRCCQPQAALLCSCQPRFSNCICVVWSWLRTFKTHLTVWTLLCSQLLPLTFKWIIFYVLISFEVILQEVVAISTNPARDPRIVPLRSMGTNGNVENNIFQLFPTHSHNYFYYFSGRNPNQFYSLKVSLQQGLFLWELYLEEREVFSLVSPLLLWFLSRLYRLGLALS